MIKNVLILLIVAISGLTYSQNNIDELAKSIEPKVIEWRRHFHQNPELSNREFKTATRIAAHLRLLGIEVQTRVAHTGVVGTLKGGLPGPVVALRADIDALPVTERVDVPFASKVKSTHNGVETGVMHACGHDAHTAMLLGVAEVLSNMKEELHGTVKFIFQPAEEGPPIGEEGGAIMMIKEGVLKNPDVDAIFGLHVSAGLPVGKISYKPEGIMASSDRFVIKVKGKQTHGSTPWGGIDPIVVSAQIANALQTVVSRQTPLTTTPAVVSIGMMQAGVRYNIIPETAEMIGTIRTFDPKVQDDIHRKIERIAINTAEGMGATAEVSIQKICPVTYNHKELTNQMLPSLQKVAGAENVVITKPITAAEDFSFYQQQVPGMFFFIGVSPEDNEEDLGLSSHHSPDYHLNEDGMLLGVKAFLQLTLDYLNTN